MADDVTADVPRVKEVPLNAAWGEPEGLAPLFSDQVHLAKVAGQFYLTFGQVRVPIARPEPGAAVEIRPITQIVIPRHALASLATLLQQALEHWEE
jgi:hypothetical protein